MDPMLLALCIFGGVCLIGVVVSGLLIWQFLQCQKPANKPVDPYWQEIFKACERAENKIRRRNHEKV